MIEREEDDSCWALLSIGGRALELRSCGSAVPRREHERTSVLPSCIGKKRKSLLKLPDRTRLLRGTRSWTLSYISQACCCRWRARPPVGPQSKREQHSSSHEHFLHLHCKLPRSSLVFFLGFSHCALDRTWPRCRCDSVKEYPGQGGRSLRLKKASPASSQNLISSTSATRKKSCQLLAFLDRPSLHHALKGLLQETAKSSTKTRTMMRSAVPTASMMIRIETTSAAAIANEKQTSAHPPRRLSQQPSCTPSLELSRSPPTASHQPPNPRPSSPGSAQASSRASKSRSPSPNTLAPARQRHNKPYV